MNAYEELLAHLEENEQVKAIVFGPWGWDGYNEPDPPPIPGEKQGKIMPLEEAAPLMEGWSFSGGFGAPECYAVYIWTTRRIFWVTQYDGATSLSWAPRYPRSIIPEMYGG